MKVTAPTVADIAGLVALGRVCHVESQFARLPYDAERVAARFAQMIAKPLPSTFFVVAHNSAGQVVGLMIGTLEEYFFCAQRVASSVFFLVHPAHRGGLAASKMVLAFRAWAQARQAVALYIGVASGVSVQRTGRFLARMGLTLSGGNYAAWLPAAPHASAAPQSATLSTPSSVLLH